MQSTNLENVKSQISHSFSISEIPTIDKYTKNDSLINEDV